MTPEIERENEQEVIPTVGILVLKDNKVLLVCHTEHAAHETGVYGFPAGRIQNGETEKDAAIRELKEETGLNTIEDYVIEYPNNTYTAEISRKEGGIKLFTIKMFICQNYNGIIMASSKTEPEWIEIEKLDTFRLLPNVSRIVQEGSDYVSKKNEQTRN